MSWTSETFSRYLPVRDWIDSESTFADYSSITDLFSIMSIATLTILLCQPHESHRARSLALLLKLLLGLILVIQVSKVDLEKFVTEAHGPGSSIKVDYLKGWHSCLERYTALIGSSIQEVIQEHWNTDWKLASWSNFVDTEQSITLVYGLLHHVSPRSLALVIAHRLKSSLLRFRSVPVLSTILGHTVRLLSWLPKGNVSCAMIGIHGCRGARVSYLAGIEYLMNPFRWGAIAIAHYLYA